MNNTAAAETLPRRHGEDTTDGGDTPQQLSPDQLLAAVTMSRVKPSVAEYMMEGLSSVGRRMVGRTSRHQTLSRSFRLDTTDHDVAHDDQATVDHEVFFSRDKSSDEAQYHTVTDDTDDVVMRVKPADHSDEPDRPRSYGIGNF